MGIHPDKPLLDGVPFDDLHGMHESISSRLIYDGLVFGTEFKRGNCTFGGFIIAGSFDAAVTAAEGRGLGEIVIGQIAARIPVQGGPTP